MGWIEDLRSDIPALSHYIYFNHSDNAPQIGSVRKAIREFLENEFQARDSMGMVEAKCPRSKVGAILGCKASEVGYSPNTSFGLVTAAQTIKFRPGDNVVVNALNHPTNIYPWLKLRGQGVDIRWVDVSKSGGVTVDELEKVVDDRTVVIAQDLVGWITGFRCDLKPIGDLIHRHGGYLVVDASQAAGGLRVDFDRNDVDFLSTACYKWLLGPNGCGFLIVKEELIEKFESPWPNWAGAEYSEPLKIFDPYQMVWRKGIQKFQLGHPASMSHIGAGAAIDVLLSIGMDKIEARLLKLTGRLYEGLSDMGQKLGTPADPKHRSGMVSLQLDDPSTMVEYLAKNKILVTARSGQGAKGIRIAPHAYNLEEEVDSFLGAIRKSEQVVRGRSVSVG